MPLRLRAVLILTALSVFTVWTVNAQAQLPSLSIDDVEQEEGSGHRFVGFADGITVTPFVFTVTLSEASANTVTITYKTRDTTADNQFPYDFYDTSGVLTFAPGETEKTVTVNVWADYNDEATEFFVVELSNPSNATIGKGVGTGTILNDDPAPTNSDLAVEIVSGSTVHVGENSTITFQVTNKGPEDITNVTWSFHEQQVPATTSQGEGCGHVFGGEGEGNTHCYLGTIASGNTATVTMGLGKIPPYCTDDTPSYNKFWLRDTSV
ncbi:MAG: large repetitive protein, partial [Thermoanaerobaculia bacterium]|nr:large repetitive protein [Thermoanaerobaculia bacterium]